MTRGGLQSSAYEKISTPTEITITSNTKILENDIVITNTLLAGDSGVFRIWWSFTTGADYALTVTKKGATDLLGFPLKVNGDNSFVLQSDGYYRFDFGVRPGDLINFSSNVDITQVNDLQIQQIQIGA